jgi:tRNA-specific 2-thiouridylase
MSGPTAIALSGGVDSLSAAALLVDAGREVIGLHFTTAYTCNEEDALDRLRAAARFLGIPLYMADLSSPFERLVAAPFAAAYMAGLTPNPCMVCNSAVKFGALLDTARALSASRLATGHYARTEQSADGTGALKKGADILKDQSYFLGFLTQDQLARAVFPLGETTKEEVRRYAAERGLGPFIREESQETCFMGNARLGDFLAKRPGYEDAPGPVVDTLGNVVGAHSGVCAYTVGQRRGLNIPSTEPWYVVKILPRERTLVVGRKHELAGTRARLTGLNWISKAVDSPARVAAKIRYRCQEAPALLVPGADGAADLVFDTPQYAVTPGQGAVFYQGDRVLGAGWIQGGG